MEEDDDNDDYDDDDRGHHGPPKRLELLSTDMAWNIRRYKAETLNSAVASPLT